MDSNENILTERKDICEAEEHKDNELVLDTPGKILEFGQEATKGVSCSADKILSQFSLPFAEKSTELLSSLNRLMSRFDKEDFREGLKNFISKLLKRTRTNAGDLFEKYRAFSGEIEKLFIDIKKYELELKDSNDVMDRVYGEGMHFYAELDGYADIARKFLAEKVEPVIESLEDKTRGPGNDIARIEMGKYAEIRETLKRRIYDLELAKAVSLQTALLIRLIQKGNCDLIRKINSVFITTIPLFKQDIIQAVTIKRQKLQMESMKALDENAGKILMQNARNIVKNARSAARMKRADAAGIEAIENSYNIIINGIKEVEWLQQDNRKQSEVSAKKLEECKNALLDGRPAASIVNAKA